MRATVHHRRQVKTMPVKRGGIIQFIQYVHAHCIALVDEQSGTPEITVDAGSNRLIPRPELPERVLQRKLKFLPI